MLTGKNLKDIHTPSLESVHNKFIREQFTNYPLRALGFNTDDGPLYLSEEERESHLHIIGSPGEGKSKFLEMMVCQDIQNLKDGKSKSGVCFIDSSDNGKTFNQVLKYCAKIGYDKVFIIEPNDISTFGYVPLLNPIDYNAPSEAVSSLIMDTVRVLWSTEDFTRESIISKYAPRVVQAIHVSQATLPDIEVFAIPEFANQRNQYIYNPELPISTRLVLQRAFSNAKEMAEFQTTARRFDPFFNHSIMKLLLGSKESANFNTLLTGGWVILCNLYREGIFEEAHQRLLGTLILNRILHSMSRVIRKQPNYNIPYYIYIDEFGQYATRKIADILYYSRKSNIRLNLAHQEFAQIENQQVLSAVKSAAKIKVLFYTASPKDRAEFLKLMFAGPIDKDSVDYVLSQTEKQHAFIKIAKQPARKVKVTDWPDTEISQEAVDAFKRNIYQLNPTLYKHKSLVWEEIKQRAISTTNQFARGENLGTKSRRHPKTPFSGKGNDNSSARQSAPLFQGSKEDKRDSDKEQRPAKGTPLPANLSQHSGVPKRPRKVRTDKKDEGDKPTSK